MPASTSFIRKEFNEIAQPTEILLMHCSNFKKEIYEGKISWITNWDYFGRSNNCYIISAYKSKCVAIPHSFTYGYCTVYLGFTFSNVGRKQDIIIEMANITMYIVLVLLSIGITPYFLIAGYFWHGVWDIIHHKKVNLIQTKVPEWYIYGCILYDWVIGIFILVWMI